MKHPDVALLLVLVLLVEVELPEAGAGAPTFPKFEPGVPFTMFPGELIGVIGAAPGIIEFWLPPGVIGFGMLGTPV